MGEGGGGGPEGQFLFHPNPFSKKRVKLCILVFFVCSKTDQGLPASNITVGQ